MLVKVPVLKLPVLRLPVLKLPVWKLPALDAPALTVFVPVTLFACVPMVALVVVLAVVLNFVLLVVLLVVRGEMTDPVLFAPPVPFVAFARVVVGIPELLEKPAGLKFTAARASLK